MSGGPVHFVWVREERADEVEVGDLMFTSDSFILYQVTGLSDGALEEIVRLDLSDVVAQHVSHEIPFARNQKILIVTRELYADSSMPLDSRLSSKAIKELLRPCAAQPGKVVP